MTALSAIVVSLAVLSAPASAGSIETRGPWTRCGDVSSLAIYDLKAKHTHCSSARKVSRKALRKMQASMNFNGTMAKGYRCRKSSSEYDGANYECKRGHKKVTFYIGG